MPDAAPQVEPLTAASPANSSPSTSADRFATIPAELRDRPQWVVWRYTARTKGKRAKPLYSPHSGRAANVNDSRTWATFDEAVAASARDGYDGIGFVFTASDPYCGVDLDGCRDVNTSALAGWAQAIVMRFATYAEVSPSGTGLKLWLKACLPGAHNKKRLSETAALEVYDTGRYFTVTGQPVAGTPTTIAACQAELDAWYAETFTLAQAAAAQHATGLPSAPQSGQQAHCCTNSEPGMGQPSPEPVDLDDAALIAQAKHGRNGARIVRLLAGDTSDHHGDASSADLALCGVFAFYTNKDPARIDRLFRRSGLYRPKWERADYRERTIQRAIDNTTRTYMPPTRLQRQQRRQQDQRVVHPYEWQQRHEAPRERNRLLHQVAEEAKEQVRAHFASGNQTPLVVALPPGVGKSYAVAPLGVDFDVAWVSERHDMRESVPALCDYYRPIERCHSGNCPDAALHDALAARSRNTWPLHRAHQCAYFAQHKEQGSAVYQVAHVQTAYPKQHQVMVTDELNLSN